MPNTPHAHIDRDATDCDGRMSHSHVVSPTPEELADQFGDIHFMERVVGSATSVYALLDTGRLDVTRTGTGTYDLKFEWSEPTEEGSIHIEGRFCTDDCNLDESSQRDHRAESMGY